MMTFTETLSSGYGQSFSVEDVLYEVQTDFQHLIIFRNSVFGTVMALDGVVQTTERDEFIYHEMMVHVPLIAHAQVKRVLIIGGGDGGILREVVKHSGVEEITQVEIDAQVIDMCKTYLPHHSNGAFDDPRVSIVIQDGVEFVSKTQQTFDVIISDCTDPIGPGEVLFTSDFYAGCKRILSADGIFVAQNGVPFMQPQELKDTQVRLGAYFNEQTFYTLTVPTYAGGVMALAWASDCLQHRCVSAEHINAYLAQHAIHTRYYTAEVHQAAFALPGYIQVLLR